MGKKAGGKGKGRKTPKPAKRKQRRSTRRAREKLSDLMDPNVSLVIADPLRLGILAIATQRPVSASEFAKEVGIATSVASYHFRVLRDRGFLELVEVVQVRGASKFMYRAARPTYISDEEFARMAHSARPGLAGEVLQDLNGRVIQAIASGTLFDRSDTCLYWVARTLDDKAWAGASEAIRWCIGELQEFEADTLGRIESGETSVEDAFPTTFAIGLFPSPPEQDPPKVKAARKKRAQPKKKKKSPASR